MTDKSKQSALVFGVGPGLGLALVRCFTKARMKVAMVARDIDRLNTYVSEYHRD